MGCDIHSRAERWTAEGGWKAVDDFEPFEERCYALFGWLAGVRNYSDLPILAPPRGIPDDASPGVRAAYEDWDVDAHSASWLSVQELLAFDYDQRVEDRRVTRQTAWGYDGGGTAAAGEGEMTTYRALFGTGYFLRLEALRSSGAERIVFWFDN